MAKAEKPVEEVAEEIVPEAMPAIAERETVTVAKDDLDYLMNEVRSLKRKVGDMDGSGGVTDTFQPQEPIVMLRVIDGKVVVRTTYAWNSKDPVSKEITAMIGLYTEDMTSDDTPIPMELVEYLRDAEQAKAHIKEKRVIDPGVEDLGLIEQTKYKDYHAERSGIRVQNRVITPVFEYDVELADGRKVTVNQNAIN